MANGKAPRRERRKRERRAFPDYMQFMNDQTGELVGDLADISLNGFRLEGARPVPPNTELPFRIDLPADISEKASIVFTARSRWSAQNPVDTRLYEAGFEITRMDPGDSHAFALIFDRYGAPSTGREMKTEYLWKE